MLETIDRIDHYVQLDPRKTVRRLASVTCIPLCMQCVRNEAPESNMNYF